MFKSSLSTRYWGELCNKGTTIRIDQVYQTENDINVRTRKVDYYDSPAHCLFDPDFRSLDRSQEPASGD